MESGQVQPPDPARLPLLAKAPVDTAASVDRQVERETIQVSYFAAPGMSARSIERFREAVRSFAVELIRETSRLEEADRVTDEEQPEITGSMVVKANNAVRSPQIPEPKQASTFATLCRSYSPVS